MGFDEIRLIAASRAGALAADPASTTTIPSSPTCTPTFAPAPTTTKNDGRTSKISRPFDGTAAACGAAALRGLRPRCGSENVVQTATMTATHARRHRLDKTEPHSALWHRGG